MNFVFRVMVIVGVLLFASAVSAQTSDVPDPLFLNDAPLPMSISGPFTTLVRERSKDDYLPGVIKYNEADGTAVSLDLEIRTRGHSRHATCDYPPVLLNLKRGQTVGTLFEHQNKLKLVIPCKYSDYWEQTVLREYLTYRILNAVTDMSFRVRLLRVSFDNTQKSKEPEVRYAFLIEHKNRLAERYGLKDLEIERTSVAAIQPDRLNLTSVFEFLIGNTDFSPIAGHPDDECCHNYVLFGNEVDPIFAIPYDFDQSGFVDAPYAMPAKQFGIRDVKQRVYRGRCVNNEYVAGSLQRFRENRKDIYKLINEQEGLSSAAHKAVTRYVDGFFELIDDPEKVERRIIDRCV
jgi:hypothetical protein